MTAHRSAALSVLVATLVGAATGLRSQSGLAATVVAGPSTTVPARLRSRLARRLVVGGAVGELAADKYPGAPSRTDVGPAAACLVLGGLSAALLTNGLRTSSVPSALLGAGAAAGTTWVGPGLRAAGARRIADPVVAVTEDVVAYSLAVSAARLALRTAS